MTNCEPKKKQDIINLSSMTPLSMHEAREIIELINYKDLSCRKTFIITNEELCFYPKETFFERAKEAIKNGTIRI